MNASDEYLAASRRAARAITDGSPLEYELARLQMLTAERRLREEERRQQQRQRELELAMAEVNPATTIEYLITRRAHTVIRVVDPSGRVVATLLDATAGPGAARVTWDGTTDGGDRAASGVYFIQLEAGGSTASRKTVLIK